MKKLGAIVAVIIATLLALASPVLAQTQVFIYGSTDGGVKGSTAPVRLDSDGRIIISNPGGGGGGGTSSVVTSDGGYVATYPVRCTSASPHSYTSVGTSSTNVPATAAAGRAYTRICVTLEASGTPQVKCRTDGVAPAFGATAGEVLSAGDCATYSLSSASNIACIANAAATPMSSFECIPTMP